MNEPGVWLLWRPGTLLKAKEGKVPGWNIHIFQRPDHTAQSSTATSVTLTETAVQKTKYYSYSVWFITAQTAGVLVMRHEFTMKQ